MLVFFFHLTRNQRIGVSPGRFGASPWRPPLVRRRQGARCPCGATEDGAAGGAQATAQVPLVGKVVVVVLRMEVDDGRLCIFFVCFDCFER